MTLEFFDKCLKVRMNVHVGQIVVVEAGTLEVSIGEVEPERLH